MHEIIFYEDSSGCKPVLEYMQELERRKSKDSRIKLNKINDYIQVLRVYGVAELSENYGLLSVCAYGEVFFYLSEQAETLIKQDFLKEECSIGAHTESSNGAPLDRREDADVVAVLQATIDILQGQLAVKDRQIEKLTEALVAAQQTAAAAQALHAGTIQQQILTGEDKASQQEQVSEQKKGWFSKFFR